MPRDPRTLIPATFASGFSLTPSDHIFLDEVDRLLHLALDRLGNVLESINPPTKYDSPAPDCPRDPEPSPFITKPELSFVPYAREFLRSVKGLQTLCNLWVMLKTTRTQPVSPSLCDVDIPVCDPPRSGANPTLLAMVENLYKTP